MTLPPPRRRRAQAGLLVVAVTAAHLGGLGAWTSAAPPTHPTSPPPSASVQVRALTIAAPAAPPVAAAPAVPLHPTEVAAAAPIAATGRTVPRAVIPAAPAGERHATARAPAPPTRVASAVPATPAAGSSDVEVASLGGLRDVAAITGEATAGDPHEPGTTVPQPEAIPAEAATLAQAAPAAARATGDPPLGTPLYATRLPPTFRWSYHLQRGLLAGTGVLDWQPAADRYHLSLTGSIAGVTLLEWISQGGFDRAGLAPTRFTVSSRGRAPQAANFQRAAGKITYSANTAERALPAGAQDRLSWLVQLSAVVAADPARHAKAGARIALPVSGTRGDLGVWDFEVLGLQPVDTPFGRVEALALRRGERHAFDTRGEVWLDAQRHHLPVQVRLSTIDGRGQVADALVLRLEGIDR